MKEIPEIKDFGRYTTQSNDLTVTVELKATLGDNPDRYFMTATFHDAYSNSRINVSYSSLYYEQLFKKLKRLEVEIGLENLFSGDWHLGENKKDTRRFIKCILSLEEQTKHVYEEIKRLKNERFSAPSIRAVEDGRGFIG